MDIDSILDDSTTQGETLVITETIRGFLSETARWGKFLAIVGFVFMGLAILGLLIGGGSLLMMDVPAGFGGAFLFIYIAIFAITLIPLYYLYSFSTQMQIALRDDNQAFLRDAFENQKSLFKFYGIFMAVVLGFYALLMVFGLFAAMF